ncbi:MAG: hypothetical protein H0T76_07135 [Nannocystis sp.]|nr:hypothetical protein [Nannocystis sp.]MBA3546237.1 hypothetical protein [Nannocystis sp.]
MHLITRLWPLMLLSAATTCGSDPANDTWMLGTFSDVQVGQLNYQSAPFYDILEDGSFVKGKIVHPGNVRVETGEYRWERRGEDEIEVLFPDVEKGGIEAWRISPGFDCNTVRVDYIQRGEPGLETALYRGAVCIEALGMKCPSGSNCDSTKAVWCDEPPPPCDEK